MHRYHAPLLVLAAVAVLLLAPAPPADAGSCYGKCEQTAQYCWTCVRSSEYTGVRCQQQGPCLCLYVDDCPYRVGDEDRDLVEPTFLVPEPNLTPFRPEPAADDIQDLLAAPA